MNRGLLWRGAALAIAVAVLVVAIRTRSDADHAADAAVAERAAARHTLASDRARLARTQSDLAAARAAVRDFTAAADRAVGASAAIVDAEAALTDRFARLQTAGSVDDIDGYNRVVAELRDHGGDLEAATHAIEAPYEDYSRALDALPTARCSAPLLRRIAWAAYGASGLQCARLAVPLDDAAPHGEQIELTVVRRPADDPGSDIGPLLVNPGGPGLSAIAALRVAGLTLPDDVLRRFDLIGVDPRGVGQSTPVDCADDLDPFFANDLTAADATARTHALRVVQQLVGQCASRSGNLLRHIGTESTARDLDRVRVALGVDKISYLGFSYGTYLGSVYAELFPRHLRAAVLDGAVPPDRALDVAGLGTDPGDVGDTLTIALAQCSADASCPFRSDGDAASAYDDLMRRLQDHPLAVGPRVLGRGLAELGVVETVYGGAEERPRLMQALAAAAVGDGTALLALSDSYTGRRRDGSYNNELEAHDAIGCVEVSDRPTPGQAFHKLRHLGRLQRFEAVGLMLDLPCAFWPAPIGAHPLRHVDGKGAPPILVIGNTGDAVTPLADAKELAHTLDSGHLLTYEGDGHTVVGRGNACIDQAVVAYLENGTTPADGTACPA